MHYPRYAQGEEHRHSKKTVAAVSAAQRFLMVGAAVASAAAVDPVEVLAASVCWLSVEASLTEARAPSLLHVEMKMALVGLICTRPEHCAEDAAGVVAD